MKKILCVIMAFVMICVSLCTVSFASQSTVKKYSKKASGDTYVSKNFKVREFACSDGSDTVLIDTELVTILQKIRDHFKKPVTINSAYRTASYNKKIGGASDSNHTKGMAADISVSGVSPVEVAKYAETIGVRGIGLYNTKKDGYFVHVDTRNTKYYWIGQAQKKTSTHGGKFNTDPYNAAAPTVNVSSYPTTIKKGSSFGLRGSVASNGLKTTVKTTVANSKGKIVLSASDTINGGSTGDIKNMNANNKLKFGSLAKGTYTLKIVATNSKGSKSFSKSFKVK